MGVTVPQLHISARRVRDLQRVVHLLTATVLLAYVYAVPIASSGFAAAVRWVALPVLALSGVALWKWPKVRSFLRRRRAAA